MSSKEGPGGGLVAQMLLCSFLWASAFLLLKIAGTGLSPLALAALRGVMGAGLLAAWLLLHRISIVPRGREWRDWAVLGLLQGVIPNALTVYALIQISAGLASMIQATTPLIVALLAQALFADEKLTARRARGLAVGFAGMILLVGPAAFDGGPVDGMGVAAMVVVAASYALGNVYVRAVPSPDPLRLAFGQQFFSGVPTFLCVMLIAGPSAFAGVADSLPVLAMLGIFGTAMPIVLYMRILRRAGPTIGSMNGYFLPPWTILLGFLLLGETISLREIAATAIVLTGVAMVTAGPKPLARFAAFIASRRG